MSETMRNLVFVIIAILIIGVGVWYFYPETNPDSGSVSNADEMGVREAVKEFIVKLPPSGDRRPDSVDIIEIKSEGKNFIVEGNVIEVVGSGKEAAAVYPVTLTLEKRSENWLVTKVSKGAYSELPQRRTIVGFWECLPHKDTSGPQTMECAFGIAVDQSDGHYAVDTSLMSTYPVDFPTGTKVSITGVVTPANQLSSIQKYDIDGIIRATVIERI